MNFKTILDAWIIANNPTEQQQKLADARLEICESCPSKTEIVKRLKMAVVCRECGCPIIKKIYTNIHNACPLQKWEDVDNEYFPTQKHKPTLL